MYLAQGLVEVNLNSYERQWHHKNRNSKITFLSQKERMAVLRQNLAGIALV